MPDIRRNTKFYLAFFIFLFFFALYSFFTSSLVGYEPETAASVEGFIKYGDFSIDANSPLSQGQGFIAPNGKKYGRVGLMQPILELPFYLVGYVLDRGVSSGKAYNYRNLMLILFSPFITAVTCSVVFLFSHLFYQSHRLSVYLALIYGLATMAFPYAKIGMEPVLTMIFILMVYSTYKAKMTGSSSLMFVTGLLGGAMVATKIYSLILVLPVFFYLMYSIWFQGSFKFNQKLLNASLFITPFIFFIGLIGLYDFVRFGSVSAMGYTLSLELQPAPILYGFYGLLFSAGKGFFLFNPPTLLAIVGFIYFYRQYKAEGLLFISLILALTLFFARLVRWSDETWGPRYLLPLVSLTVILLGPLFIPSLKRFRYWLVGLGVVGFFIQMLGVLVTYSDAVMVLVKAGQLQSRQHYQYIPHLSHIRINWLLLKSKVLQYFTGRSLVFTYAPEFSAVPTYQDIPHIVNLKEFMPLIPNLWWRYVASNQGITNAVGLSKRITYSMLAILIAMMLTSGIAIYRRAKNLPKIDLNFS